MIQIFFPNYNFIIVYLLYCIIIKYIYFYQIITERYIKHCLPVTCNGKRIWDTLKECFWKAHEITYFSNKEIFRSPATNLESARRF